MLLIQSRHIYWVILGPEEMRLWTKETCLSFNLEPSEGDRQQGDTVIALLELWQVHEEKKTGHSESMH